MKQQLNSLQLYRGLASLLVVLTHANIILERELTKDISFNFFHFGWIGVDFFFVLSGFIIFYIHQSDLGRADRFKSFVSKRFFRVYPLYWIVLSTKILLSLVGDKNGEIYQLNFWQFWQAFLLVPQERANLENFIGVSWTLTYEIFFYFIFSLLILIDRKFAKPIFSIWVAGIILNLFGLIPGQELLLVDFIFNERNLEFIFGCAAAYIISNHRVRYPLPTIYFALTLVILAVANTAYRQFDTAGISPAIAYGIPFTLLVIGSVQLEKIKPLKIPFIFIYLGNASYSIYLTHGFFIKSITKIYVKFMPKLNQGLAAIPSDVLHIGFTSLIVLLSIAMGCLVYSCVEKPLLTLFRT